MKLILAIVNDDDASNVMDELNANDYRVTRMCSTGGFLRAGNTTLLVGVEEEHVQAVLSVIEARSRSTTKSISSSQVAGMSYPIEVTVGGATVFVVDVEQFIKY
ncbi:MAG: cyclic-di-AMP receptor [Clostridia bacterium]|nr:cyclic-di-AMP receptor [Clostridia bacterium]